MSFYNNNTKQVSDLKYTWTNPDWVISSAGDVKIILLKVFFSKNVHFRPNVVLG